MSFTFEPCKDLPDVVLITAKRYEDARGWFMETYREDAFGAHGIPTRFPQDNHSRTRLAGSLRGLHFQRAPFAQGHLVRCVRGRAFDVAVDLRAGSPTFARWVGVELSEHVPCSLWIPPGFAHGFCTLENDTELVYNMSSEYRADHEGVVRWNDPDIGIRWPVARPQMNERDANAPLLRDSSANHVWRGTS